jgi:hypothetical protein
MSRHPILPERRLSPVESILVSGGIVAVCTFAFVGALQFASKWTGQWPIVALAGAALGLGISFQLLTNSAIRRRLLGEDNYASQIAWAGVVTPLAILAYTGGTVLWGVSSIAAAAVALGAFAPFQYFVWRTNTRPRTRDLVRANSDRARAAITEGETDALDS